MRVLLTLTHTATVSVHEAAERVLEGNIPSQSRSHGGTLPHHCISLLQPRPLAVRSALGETSSATRTVTTQRAGEWGPAFLTLSGAPRASESHSFQGGKPGGTKLLVLVHPKCMSHPSYREFKGLLAFSNWQPFAIRTSRGSGWCEWRARSAALDRVIKKEEAQSGLAI